MFYCTVNTQSCQVNVSLRTGIQVGQPTKFLRCQVHRRTHTDIRAHTHKTHTRTRGHTHTHKRLRLPENNTEPQTNNPVGGETKWWKWFPSEQCTKATLWSEGHNITLGSHSAEPLGRALCIRLLPLRRRSDSVPATPPAPRYCHPSEQAPFNLHAPQRITWPHHSLAHTPYMHV